MRRATQQPAGHLKCGDHIVTPRPGFKHHGIYIGNGQVVHYARANNPARTRTIIQVSLTDFENGYGFTIVRSSSKRYRRQQILARARSRLGESRYNLLRNNCEHFCTWCIRGEPVSAQVRHYALVAPLIFGLLTSTLITGLTPFA